MEIFRRAASRKKSFQVVDMPPDSSIPFKIDNQKLAQLVKTKNQDILRDLGGVEGIISPLQSNAATLGIRGDSEDLFRRRKVFGSNHYSQKFSISKLLMSILCSFKDFSMLMTLACGVYLIIAGVAMSDQGYGWEEGAYSLLFFFVFYVFASMVELGIGAYAGKVIKKSRCFVVVLRNGLKQKIPFSEVVVGDIVYLKSGDSIPADGLFLEGHDLTLKLDESLLTGVSDSVEVDDSNPFLRAGAKLVQGHGKMVVTGVGKNTFCYDIKGTLYRQETTQLEARLHFLARHLERAKWILAITFLPISLARYFSGNTEDGDGYREFSPGTTTALQVSYVFVENIVAVVAISIAMDTTNMSWAVKFSLANAVNGMAAKKIVVRNFSEWEKIELGTAIVNVVGGGNTLTTSKMEVSKFLSVPQFLENTETPSLISPNVFELVRQGIGLNTKGIAFLGASKNEFSGSPSERAILSYAALELDMDLEKLNQNYIVREVEELEMESRGILLQKGDIFHAHMRGRAEMVLRLCSSFYDALGSLSLLNEDTRNLIEAKIRSVEAEGMIRVAGLAHRQLSEEVVGDIQDSSGRGFVYNLLGFLVLKEINQDEILKRVEEEYLSAGVGFNVIANINPVNGTSELELNHGSQDKTFAEEMISSGEDDESVSLGKGDEETISLEGRSDYASMDEVKVAKFFLVEELAGSESLSSTSPLVLEMLKQGIGQNTDTVVPCNNLPESPIEKAILSWLIHELNLDTEESEKNFSIIRFANFNHESQDSGILMSLENGTLLMHEKGPPEVLLTMCSSYYCISGDEKVFDDHQRIQLEEKLQYLESKKCHWAAFVHSQIVQDTTQDCFTLLGILICDQESVDDNTPDEALMLDDGELNSPKSNPTVEDDDEIKVISDANVLVSIGIEGDEITKNSHIVILDGNYSTLTQIMRWARCFSHNTQMFLQFQLTTSITSLFNTYISTVTLSGTPGVDTRLVYVLVQLIWVNLGMGLIAAVTFGRQKPQPCFNNDLTQKPSAEGQKWKLVTGYMWRNVIGQIAYQILAISILQFQGTAIFGFTDDEKDTVTFVVPIFLQVFNMVNARKMEDKNVFSGIQASFVGLMAILMAVPFVLVEVVGDVVDFAGLDLKQWIICIGIAIVCWPVGFAVKFVPVAFLASPVMIVLSGLKALLRKLKKPKIHK